MPYKHQVLRISTYKQRPCCLAHSPTLSSSGPSLVPGPRGAFLCPVDNAVSMHHGITIISTSRKIDLQIKSLRLESCLETATAESSLPPFSPNQTPRWLNQTDPEIVISRSCPSLEHARGDPDLWFAAASVCRY